MPSTRLIRKEELPQLLDLYGFLHSEDPDITNDPRLPEHWEKICSNPDLRYFVVESDGVVVSTCTITIIPNLTRSMCPYGLIENVVTLPAHRKQGYGRQVVQAALQYARERECYKVMLLTGSKQPEVLRFYEQCGFKGGVKTAFVVMPP